jgi:sulfate transport system ATP-binding protein
MSLKINNLSKQFSGFSALKDISFEVSEGEFIALLGPSGSGKTTLLRMLAGLDYPDNGSIDFKGQNFLSLPVKERKTGMVFQSYALFRHMTVAKNIAFGLEMRGKNKPPRKEINDTINRLLKLVQLEGFEQRYPAQLSGGQRQRVALARALAINPSLLLLDEPFGALDAMVRKELRRWLRHIHDETGLTTIFVTHDQEEALDLADRIVLLEAGKIAQYDTADKIINHPNCEFVFDFVGSGNAGIAQINDDIAQINGSTFPVINEAKLSGNHKVKFRNYDAIITKEDKGIKAKLTGIFASAGFLRFEARDDEGQHFEIIIPERNFDHSLKVGDVVGIAPQKAYLF